MTNYHEADFQTAWNKWVRNNWEEGSAAFELKICKGKSLPFNAVKPHQIEGLLEAKHGCLPWKLSDIDPRQKPFDSIVLTKSLAYVTLMYYPEKVAYLIDVDDWVKELAHSKRKSITKDRAKDISTHIIKI